MEADGFTIVKNKKKKQTNGFHERRTTILSSESIEIIFDSEALKKRINSAVIDVESSEYFVQVVETVQSSVNHSIISLDSVYCFGLGHFADSVTAKYQLALLLAIASRLRLRPQQVFISDPIFYKGEVEFLKSELKFNVLTENIECRLPCDQPTLILLPHCPKQLTNNLLFSNWSQEKLKNLFIISNSINNIISNKNLQFIRAVIDNGIVCETQLKNNFKYSDIFNDLSLHTFGAPDNIESSVWSLPEPAYEKEDAEFIKRSEEVDKV